MDVTTPPTGLPAGSAARLRQHLEVLYPAAVAADTHAGLLSLLEDFVARCGRRTPTPLFDETDVVLITYADQITDGSAASGRTPLQTLGTFMRRHLRGTINGVHLLPFYPWTSDDGFAVADHNRIDPNVGTWEDVEALARDFRVMVDAVFNHVSTASPWFTGWRTGDPAYDDWFITVDPTTDLSRVVRPRTHPVLSPVETARGLRHVWTTFSPDQVDVNAANPRVVLELTRSLLRYVEHGAGIVRLDAIAFLWKEIGTSCVHLPQTHELVRLWRTVLDAVAPGTLLITETNVPHLENIRYFGDGHREAHLVYQFPLAPLVLSAFLSGDARPLQLWGQGLRVPSDETAYFNFLGSHDGVGVRPAEGLLPDEEIERLVEVVRARGGGVSYRVLPDGTQRPYELNTVFFDALNGARDEPLERQVRRFVCAQSILLVLAGVPALYVQALVGSRNWHAGVQQTGRLRSINRQKFEAADLERELADPSSLRHVVFERLCRLVRIRTAQPAFHPNGAQLVRTSDPQVLILERVAPDGTSGVVCVHEIAGHPRLLRVTTAAEAGGSPLVDLLSGRVFRPAGGVLDVPLDAYEVRWLRWPPVSPNGQAHAAAAAL